MLFIWTHNFESHNFPYQSLLSDYLYYMYVCIYDFLQITMQVHCNYVLLEVVMNNKEEFKFYIMEFGVMYVYVISLLVLIVLM